MDWDWYDELVGGGVPEPIVGTAYLRVRALTGEVVAEFELLLTATVAAAKEKICEAAGVPTWEQSLVLATNVTGPLKDRDRIGELTSAGGETLEVTMVRIERLLAFSWSADRTLRLWDLMVGEEVHTFGGSAETTVPRGVQIDPEWSFALTWGGDKVIHVWDLQRGILLQSLHGHTAEVLGLHVDWAQRHVLSWSIDRSLRLWDLEGDTCLELGRHSGRILGVLAGWKQGSAVSWDDDSVFLWALASRRPRRVLEGLSDVCVCAVAPAWTHAFVAGANFSLHIWDWDRDALVPVGQQSESPNIPEADVDWECMRGVSWDAETCTVQFWDGQGNTQTEAVPGLFAVQADWRHDCVLSWSVCNDLLQPQLWDVGRAAATVLARPRGSATRCMCRVGSGIRVEVDWEECRAVTWSDDCLVPRLWDLERGVVIHQLRGHTSEVRGLQVDWLQEHALTWSCGAGDPSLRLWDLAQGTLVHTMRRDPLGGFGVQVDWGQNRALCWSSDKWSSLYSGSFTMELWDLAAGELLNVVKGHDDVIRGAIMAPEGYRTRHRRSTPAALARPVPSSRLGDEAATVGGHLLKSFIAGKLDALIAEYVEVLCEMPGGLSLQACLDASEGRASGVPNPRSDAYLPTRSAGDRARLLMLGNAITKGFPCVNSPPICPAIARRNAAALFVENAGWSGLMSMSLSKPQDFHNKHGALPLPRPGEFKCDYACILLGTNDAMAIAGSAAFVQMVYVDTQADEFPRLPRDWSASCRPSPELYENGLRAAVRELMSAGACVVLATPTPLGEDLADAPPPADRHVRRPPFGVVSELAGAVWRVAATEGCDVLPLFECCVHRLRELREGGRQLVPWSPKLMFQLQHRGFMLGTRDPSKTLALSYDFVHLNEACAAIYAALLQTWIDGQLRGS